MTLHVLHIYLLSTLLMRHKEDGLLYRGANFLYQAVTLLVDFLMFLTVNLLGSAGAPAAAARDPQTYGSRAPSNLDLVPN